MSTMAKRNPAAAPAPMTLVKVIASPTTGFQFGERPGDRGLVGTYLYSGSLKPAAG